MFNHYLNEIYCFHTEQSSTKFVLIWSYDTHMVIRYNPHKKYLPLRWGTMKQNREGWWWWWWGWGIMKQEQRWEIQLSFKTFFFHAIKKDLKLEQNSRAVLQLCLEGSFKIWNWACMISIEYFTLFCFCKNLFYVWKYLRFGSDLKIITFWKIQRKSKMGCLYKSRYTFLFLISSCDFIIGCSYHTSVRTSTKEGLCWKKIWHLVETTKSFSH